MANNVIEFPGSRHVYRMEWDLKGRPIRQAGRTDERCSGLRLCAVL